MRAGGLVCLLAAACGASSPTSLTGLPPGSLSGSPPGSPPGSPSTLSTQPFVPGAASSADPGEVQAVEALLARLAPALDRCEAAIPSTLPEELTAVVTAIVAACGEAAAAHDGAVATLGGRSRATDTLIAHLARLADDGDYLARTLTGAGPEKLNAIQHVRGAVAAARAGASQWAAQGHDTYAGSAAAEDGWQRAVDSDVGAARELRPMLDHLCFNQGLKDPRLIRARMLLAVSRPAAAEREARIRALPSMGVDPDERARREAYLAAQRALFSTYDDLVDRFRSGKITTRELKAEQEQRIDGAIAAFDEAVATWRAGQPR